MGWRACSVAVVAALVWLAPIGCAPREVVVTTIPKEPIFVDPGDFSAGPPPPGAYIAAVSGSTLLLANRDLPVLSLLDVEKGTLEVRDLPIVPRVVLPLGEGGPYAIFGGTPLGGRLGATDQFLLFDGRALTKYKTAEPMLVTQGARSGQDMLILEDEKFATLAFISVAQLKAGTSQIVAKGGLPISRLPLEAEPFHFTVVEPLAIVISYRERGYIEVLDLRDPSVRVYTKLLGGQGACVRFASLPGSPRFFALDETGEFLQLFEIRRIKGRWLQVDAEDTIESGFGFSDSGSCRDRSTQGFILKVSRDTLWIGRRNRIAAARAIRDGSRMRLESLGFVELELREINAIQFIDDVVAVSGEGTVLVEKREDLLDRMRSQKSSALVDEGVVLAGRGRLSDAISRYEAALLLTPDNAEAYQYLGYAKLRRAQISPGSHPADMDEAVADLERSVAISAEHVWGHYNLALAYWEAGRQDEAVSSLRRVLEIRPEMIETIRGDAQFRRFRKSKDYLEWIAPPVAADQ